MCSCQEKLFNFWGVSMGFADLKYLLNNQAHGCAAAPLGHRSSCFGAESWEDLHNFFLRSSCCDGVSLGHGALMLPAPLIPLHSVHQKAADGAEGLGLLWFYALYAHLMALSHIFHCLMHTWYKQGHAVGLFNPGSWQRAHLCWTGGRFRRGIPPGCKCCAFVVCVAWHLGWHAATGAELPW